MLVGIGRDNVNATIEENSGLYASCIRCSEIFPRHLEFLATKAYSWFNWFRSHQLAYKQLHATINDDHCPLKIVQACQTRWLSVASIVRRLCDQWVQLKCDTSEMLFNMFNEQ
ncbi:uncharacterized protein LOC111621835 [Centruroides sculpturatus]|uniref:uncharacterized protein LOC111620642 n=1 Tax=Centruroides sculpturatus TaxID=218467 RepID=UPI000C6D90D1|nr:uncharacterized protein LOC111620642 [Centruroides sculpturatus]XP_023219867.1 uncharacterized protein LOC111621835 [Centruroides sculpturatus]